MSEVAKHPGGRPLSTVKPFSQAVADTICERLSNGESLISICGDKGFPSRPTIIEWTKRDPEFGLQYARAREHQAEYFVDELTLIADDGRNDFMMKARERGDDFIDVNREHLERSKTRIATRQWVIERILSNKYGPKPQVVVNNQQNNVVSVDPIEAAQVYQKTINGG